MANMLKSPADYATEILDSCCNCKNEAMAMVVEIARKHTVIPAHYLAHVGREIMARNV